MDEKQKNNKDLFIDLLSSVNRKNMAPLINYLEESDFFEAPASTKYHACYSGGLLNHSLNVYFNLVKLNDGSYNDDTLKIVALLHDICKANIYIKTLKNVKSEDGSWEQVLSYKVEDNYPLGHGEKSVILVQRFIELTTDEIIAIRWHMGGFESKDNYLYLSKAFSKCKLAVLLHMADLKATYLDEKESN